MALQETTQALRVQNTELKTEYAGLLDRLEILRPALQAADTLQRVTELNLDEPDSTPDSSFEP